MFFVAEHKNYCGKNPFLRLWYRLKPVRSKTKKVRRELYRCEMIEVHTVCGKLNADRANAALFSYSRRLILPDTLKGMGLDCFDSSEYLRGILFNTAVYILGRAQTDKRSLTATVIDRTGSYARRAVQLFRVAGCVQIYTEQPQKYRLLSNDALERFGTDFVIRPQNSSTAELDFVLSPDETPPCIYINNERNELDESVFKAANGFSRLCPSGVSDCDLAAAIAVFDKQSRFFSLRSETLRCGKNIIRTNEIEL